jgi:hypothetical protein
MKEAGVDAGGIFREFMNIITESAFSLEFGLFKVTVLSIYFVDLLQ